MNLVKKLQQPISKSQCEEIVAYIGEDKERFKTLIRIFLEGSTRVTQRAAWPLSYCVKNHPALIRPYLKQIISNLKKPGIHDAVKRNTVRLLQYISIPKNVQAQAIDVCFSLLQNKKEPVAIRVFSMQVLGDLCAEHPELINELRPLIEDQMPFGSPGFISRGKKVLQQISKKERLTR